MGCIYYFTLRVTSDYNPTVSSFASQTISMQSDNPLFVAIVCIENCAHNIYNPKSIVQLEAMCHDCESGYIDYKWYVDGVYTLSGDMFTILTNFEEPGFKVELIAMAVDGRKGKDMQQLVKRMPPIGGSCIVEPSSGIESTTWFKFCCQNYRATFQPLNYFIYSNDMLLAICTSCNCETVLPLDAQKIKVLICSDMLICTELILSVKLEAMKMKSINTEQDVLRLLNTKPSPMEEAKKGEIQRLLMVTESIAWRINSTNQANAILDAYEKLNPRSMISLGMMAKMMITFANRLSPVDHAYHNVLTKSLTILNSIFKNVCDDDMQQLMIKHPFVNISRACVTVYKRMNSLNKDLIPPQDIYNRYVKSLRSQTLTQNMIDRLIDESNSIPEKFVRETSLLWLNSMWQTERLYRFLSLSREHALQPSTKSTIDRQCMNITANTEYVIVSSDNRHVVRFSPELLQETKDPNSDYLCLQVTSTFRNMNWWYPEDRRPSLTLLSVQIYAHEDQFKREVDLYHSHISYVRKHLSTRTVNKMSELWGRLEQGIHINRRYLDTLCLLHTLHFQICDYTLHHFQWLKGISICMQRSNIYTYIHT